MFGKLLSILLPILLGYFLRKLKYFPDKAAPMVRQLVVRVAVPALVFMNIYQSDHGEIGQFLPMAWSLILFSVLLWPIAFLFTRISLWKKHSLENMLLILFSNVGFIGWAVIQGILGEEGLRRGIYFTSFWWINLFSISFVTHRFLAPEGKSLTLKSLLPQLLPALIALGLGYSLRSIAIPTVFVEFLESFGSMTVPLILFSLGLSIQLKKSLAQWKELLPLVILRHVPIAFAMFLTLLLLPSLDAVSRKVLWIEAFMPVAAAVLIVGEIFQADEEYLASATALSTISSFLSIPLLLHFFQGA